MGIEPWLVAFLKTHNSKLYAEDLFSEAPAHFCMSSSCIFCPVSLFSPPLPSSPLLSSPLFVSYSVIFIYKCNAFIILYISLIPAASTGLMN